MRGIARRRPGVARMIGIMRVEGIGRGSGSGRGIVMRAVGGMIEGAATTTGAMRIGAERAGIRAIGGGRTIGVGVTIGIGRSRLRVLGDATSEVSAV